MGSRPGSDCKHKKQKKKNVMEVRRLVGDKNNTGRMSVKRTNRKKQTHADICIGRGWHTPMCIHIYLYEYLRAGRKRSHTSASSHILQPGTYPVTRRYALGNWYCLPERVSTLREWLPELPPPTPTSRHSFYGNRKIQNGNQCNAPQAWGTKKGQRMHKQATSDY